MISRQEYQIESRILEQCLKTGRHLATAESCTGGLLAHRLTRVPGASAVYLGGIVAYDNAVKRKVLGVSEQTLETFGAVSEETVREMALRARDLFGADLAVSSSGIAGPSGGSAAKPVGLVYLGVAHAEGVRVTRNIFDGGRDAVQAQSADEALRMLAEVLGV